MSLSLQIITFNCGRALLDTEAFATGNFSNTSKASKSYSSFPDILVFSLQEVAPLAYSFLGGALLLPYFSRFIQAVQTAAGSDSQYQHLITHNVGMTGIIVLVRPEISNNIRWLQTAEVGVGWAEMGNKGAAGVRLGYKAEEMQGIVPLTFVAAHLAPMEDAWERRNEDWESIVRRLVFKSAASNSNTASLTKTTAPAPSGAGEDDTAGEEEPLLSSSSAAPTPPQHAQRMFIRCAPIFFAGDLNYRTSDLPPHPSDASTFPQPVSSDSNPLHWSHLLPADQLTRERKAGRTLHGLTEAEIQFPPTYKFSSKQQENMSRAQFTDTKVQEREVEKWEWSGHRVPSWCDRVLFSTGLDDGALHEVRYDALPIQSTSDHRPVAFSCSIDLSATSEALESQKSPFTQDESWEGRRLAARRKELATGAACYLGGTWEGNAQVAAAVLGLVGVVWIAGGLG